MSILSEHREYLASLAPSDIQSWVLNPGQTLPKNPRVSINLERGVVHFIQQLEKAENKSKDEKKLLKCLQRLLERVRAHLRSPGMVLRTNQYAKERMPLKKKQRELFEQAVREAEKKEWLIKKAQADKEAKRKAAEVARKAEHSAKYGPPAGSQAQGRSKQGKGSVRTVQGGAPGLGKRA